MIKKYIEKQFEESLEVDKIKTIIYKSNEYAIYCILGFVEIKYPVRIKIVLKELIIKNKEGNFNKFCHNHGGVIKDFFGEEIIITKDLILYFFLIKTY